MIARNDSHLAQNAFLGAALEYAARGWAVLPVWWPDASTPTGCACYDLRYVPSHTCDKPGKHPLGLLVPHGIKDATHDAGILTEWWSRFPRANVGIACGAASGFDVLDVDGDEGKATLAALEREHGQLPTSIEAITGSGARHVLFRHVQGLKNAVSFAPKLEIRTDGGLIVAEPSRHVSGGAYAWNIEHHPDDAELAPWPTWLEELVRAASVTSAPAPAADGGLISEGSRNSTLTSLAGSMRRPGMSEAAIAAALLAENEARCRPPLPEAEVRGIAASVSKYAPTGAAPPVATQVPRGGPSPTHDRESEVALLACLVKDPVASEAGCQVAGGLAASDFYDGGTRQIRLAMLAVQARGGRPDPVTLRLELEGKDGAGTLAEVLAARPAVATENAEILAKRVRELARGREMRRAARAVQEALAQGDEAGLAAAELAVREVTAQFQPPAIEAVSLPFLSIAQVLQRAKENPREWLLELLIPFGAIVLLVGTGKVSGKSTLTWAVIASALRGEDLFGRPLTCGPVAVVVLTEETEVDVAEKVGALGIAPDTAAIALVPVAACSPRPTWEAAGGAALEKARAMVAAGPYRKALLVVDTWAKWTRMEDENKAGPNLEALAVLESARRDGIAVLALHHPSKTEGREGGNASRGNSALPGEVDATIELRNAKDKEAPNRRTLHVESRASGIRDVLISLVKGDPVLGQPDRYEEVGEVAAVRRQDTDRQILAFVAENVGATGKEIEAGAGGGPGRDGADVAPPALRHEATRPHREGAGQVAVPLLAPR